MKLTTDGKQNNEERKTGAAVVCPSYQAVLWQIFAA